MDDALDQVWKALSDPTRREILDLLRDGSKTTTQIVESFDGLSRFGVMKHLDVLKQCRLVMTRKEGRFRHHSINAVPLQQIYERWVRKYEGLWAGNLLRVKDSAENADHDGKG